MRESLAFSRALFGAMLMALGLVGCVGQEEEGCFNERSLWLNKVILRSDCEDCALFEFSSPILDSDEFLIHSEPDLVLETCDVIEAELLDTSVSLYLSEPAYRKIAAILDKWKDADSPTLVAIRLENSSSLVSVKHLEDLGLILTLFDFSSRLEAEAFVGSLGSLASSERTEAVPPIGRLEESEAAEQAQEFLEESERAEALFRELEEHLDGPDAEQAFGEFFTEMEELTSP